ncbi:MAG: biopolymer transporter ExbD [Acidithiobacillus sp.]|jgi:biopolymer transport protein ExbD|uniref:Biopolymer transport protein, ExbD/TolR family n=3 Tax=Acidithiobacillus TaxID=119977 RepID=B7J509_ACIF2|nr:MULTISPECIES: biopolymer transporter ExbD [Acidithiobacillus]EGQ62877.1 biopolymer transport protein, ExbD/TolR family [Acidithiobacillus sp. GGI-221]MCL4526933.1 biopolymer transporter ExbD [Gammaproteobacteria bacterium]ACH82899.1 Biopolymer transport protein ExbD/TolR [Acidithiobacillus ferrooxidans ATCC 53993]ACK78437.1 biopolymer transport protein, ExbD/TolR family [Acidithiobacillus ferrooxidans ATCC 23270]MBN6746334.1 biopolymer transporter ExbD [Acidithiobacillus sp. MC2.2]
MNLRQRVSEEPEINVISMVDIVLVLLLFFMVTSSFVHQSHLSMELPKAQQATAGEPKTPITIDLSAAGQVRMNKQVVPMSDLAGQLKALAAKDPERVIVLRADKNTTQQYVIDVLDAAQEAGLTRISFATLSNH